MPIFNGGHEFQTRATTHIRDENVSHTNFNDVIWIECDLADVEEEEALTYPVMVRVPGQPGVWHQVDTLTEMSERIAMAQQQPLRKVRQPRITQIARPVVVSDSKRNDPQPRRSGSRASATPAPQPKLPTRNETILPYLDRVITEFKAKTLTSHVDQETKAELEGFLAQFQRLRESIGTREKHIEVPRNDTPVNDLSCQQVARNAQSYEGEAQYKPHSSREVIGFIQSRRWALLICHRIPRVT